MFKLKGRILLFDTVDCFGNIFSEESKITIPQKVPLTWEFNHDQIIGTAEVTKDNKGLVATAEIFKDDIAVIFTGGKFGAGGFYTNVKGHEQCDDGGGLTIIDEVTLEEVALVLVPVHQEYGFEIVKEKKED